jgi:hypothetical protein
MRALHRKVASRPFFAIPNIASASSSVLPFATTVVMITLGGSGF